ncbi:MAG: hypothetical protein H6Q00_829 [Holophagaceae bacterium]|nr:hypothetical protein [Holophagaceae bacterium]
MGWRKAADLDPGGAEMDQEACRQARSFEVVEALGGVKVFQDSEGFELHEDPVFYQDASGLAADQDAIVVDLDGVLGRGVHA